MHVFTKLNCAKFVEKVWRIILETLAKFVAKIRPSFCRKLGQLYGENWAKFLKEIRSNFQSGILGLVPFARIVDH